jgi:hypothetical protein
MRRNFNKMFTLFAMLAAAGVDSTAGFKGTEKGSKTSLAGFSENNFGGLSYKRVNGKWRVKR